MSAYDPTKVRVRDGWLVVLMDERQDRLASGLVLPVETGAEKVTEGMATIVRVGDGVKNKTLGLEVGMRIALRSYLKYANPIPNSETWPSGSGKEYFIMSSDDVMGILAPGVTVGVFSSPAQNQPLQGE